jgi:hypothetical protein
MPRARLVADGAAGEAALGPLLFAAIRCGPGGFLRLQAATFTSGIVMRERILLIRR